MTSKTLLQNKRVAVKLFIETPSLVEEKVPSFESGNQESLGTELRFKNPSGNVT